MEHTYPTFSLLITKIDYVRTYKQCESFFLVPVNCPFGSFTYSSDLTGSHLHALSHSHVLMYDRGEKRVD